MPGDCLSPMPEPLGQGAGATGEGWVLAAGKEARGHGRKAVEATNGQTPGVRGCLGARDSPGQRAGQESG